MNAGNVVLASFITPFQKDRDLVKEIVGKIQLFRGICKYQFSNMY